MDYGDFNDLPRRIASGKILHDKDKTLLRIQNLMDINAVLLQCLIEFLMKSPLQFVLLKLCQANN